LCEEKIDTHFLTPERTLPLILIGTQLERLTERLKDKPSRGLKGPSNHLSYPGMTDFGGAGHGGTIAECELNLPDQSVAGSATLTSSDLNELGCTSSTSAKSSSESGISSAKSDHSKRRLSSTNSHHPSTVKSGSLYSLFRKPRCHREVNREATSKHPTAPTRSRSTVPTETSRKPKNDRRARSSSRIFVEILRTLTGGFANCSKKGNSEEDNTSRRGSNSCSNSDEISNNLDILNQYPNSQSRRKSHDGSHDGTNGSDSTSTGYVSDSSNEKHYPKNNTGKNSKPVVTVATISAQVCTRSLQAEEDAKAAELATAWSEAMKTAATIRRPTTDSTLDQTLKKAPDDEKESSNAIANAVEDENAPTSSSKRDSTSSERDNSYELMGDTRFCYVPSSASEEVSGTEDSLYTSATESGSSDYETNETSSYEEETDEKELKAIKRNDKLDIIKEEDEDETSRSNVKVKVKRRKSTLKRKRTLKGQDDLKSGMKSTLASLKAKEEDNVSRTGSLKDMILQFETAVAALEIGEANRFESEFDFGDKETIHKSPLQGVKAIAQKIHEQTMLESPEIEGMMPPSQILRLRQALEAESAMCQPIPLSRRSESRVAQIARQLAEAEREREVSAIVSGQSPKAIKKTQSSTSFINELLEMARAESVDKLHESSNHEEAPDFKQSLLAARNKITQRNDEVKATKVTKVTKGLTAPKGLTLLSIGSTVSASSLSSEGASAGPNVNEEIDPFVKEVLRSSTVPEPVKNKIRVECWSLFNDPRTPKGVKQCILATMLSKVQNE